MIPDPILEIGADCCLSPAELGAAARPAALLAWDVYDAHFDRFTGARLDPQFARLDRPPIATGQPEVAPGTTVVVTGAGLSLADVAGELARARDRVSIWCSPRGAEALALYDLEPDLVLVQHQSDLDAYLSERHVGDRGGERVICRAPQVLAEPRTPASLLARVPGHRLAAFDGATGWGRWPASLARLAAGAGAEAVALAGIDLGRPGQPDPAHEALVALLALVAASTGTVTLDVGGGAAKPGWPRAPLRRVAGSRGSRTVEMGRGSRPDRGAERAAIEAHLRYLAAPIEAAENFRALALQRRNRGAGGAECSRLADAWSTLVEWRHDPALRLAIQDGLGIGLLPRLWRQASTVVGGPLWRPVLLVTDEIVRQARRARERLASRAEARIA